MKYASSDFFHYTNSLETVKKILTGGFGMFYCREDLYQKKCVVEHIAIPMVCFCDIPLGFISSNTYGKYIIGMKRSWGIRAGLMPVMYYPNNSRCPSTKDVLRATESFKTDPYDTAKYSILGYSKPIKKIGKSSNKHPRPKNNYLEREWRKIYLASSPYRWKNDEEYDTYRGDVTSPKATVGNPVCFGENDVDMIIVPQSDVSSLIKFISGTSFCKLGGKQGKVKPIQCTRLISKIIPFESLVNNV